MHNEELETAFRQTAALLDRLGTRLENDPAVNRPEPEIGLRYGDRLEATATSIGELRWRVRENFAQFLHQNLEQHHNRQIGSAYQTNPSFRQPAKSGGEYALPANQYDPTDAAIRQDNTAQEQAHTVTTVTTDRTIEVPAPAQTDPVEDHSRTRKLDNGFAIW
jgi:hypothetical protein